MDPICNEVHIPQMLSWAAGILALAVVGIAARIEAMAKIARDIQVKITDCKTMHEHPDDYGFGSKETNEMMRGLVIATEASSRESEKVFRALTTMIHYITYDIKQRTGKTPPPPTPTGRS